MHFARQTPHLWDPLSEAYHSLIHSIIEASQGDWQMGKANSVTAKQNIREICQPPVSTTADLRSGLL